MAFLEQFIKYIILYLKYNLFSFFLSSNNLKQVGVLGAKLLFRSQGFDFQT